jgi:hypothetical protein
VTLPAADPKHARELLEQGFTVFEHAYTDDEVDFFRQHIVDTWTRLGRPALVASPPSHPAEDVAIGPAGMVLLKLTRHFPEMASRLYKRPIIETLRAVLGDDMYLELPAGALSDATRPFFDWHMHVDGIDPATFLLEKRPFPTFERSQRVTHLLYLDDVTEESGLLFLYPRRITDPTAPPFETTAERWEGQVVVSCPRGSVVVIEQCTWHAAGRKRGAGLRGFIGSYFAAAGARTTPLADASLADWDGADGLFKSVLRRR